MIVCMYGVRKVIAHGYTQSGCIQYSKYSYVIHTYVYMSLYMSQCVYMYIPMSSLETGKYSRSYSTVLQLYCTVLQLYCTVQHCTALYCTVLLLYLNAICSNLIKKLFAFIYHLAK